MSLILPTALHETPLAAAYLEALGQQHQVPLLSFCRRLESWAQHVLMQHAAEAEIDTTRAVSFAFALPDNLPLAVPINAVREEAALVALWQQQGLGKATPTPLLLPLLACAWWQVVMGEAPEQLPQNPWGRLLHTLYVLRRHSHSVHSLRLLVATLYDLNDHWQQYAQQVLHLSLDAHPQWLRFEQQVQQQSEAMECTPAGEEIAIRNRLLPLWLVDDWAELLQHHGLLPNLPPDMKLIKSLHETLPLHAVFTQLLALYAQPYEGLPPLCVSGARVAMEWRLMAEQLLHKGQHQ